LLKRFDISFDRVNNIDHPIAQHIYQFQSESVENTRRIFLIFYVTPRA